MNKNVDLLTTHDVGRALISMMLPVLLGIISVLIFNVVDTLFASWLGADALAAISFTFPVVAFASAFLTALNVSAVVFVSSILGANDIRKTQIFSRDVFLLGLVFSLLVLIIGLNTIKPLFLHLGARESAIPLIYSYMSIWYPSMVLLTLLTVTNSLFRAMGDMRTSTFLMILSILFNIILDPILMFGFAFIPSMGLKGAAWAGLISRGIVLVISLRFLLKKKMIILSIPSLKLLWMHWKSLLSIALPVSATNLFFPLSSMLITFLLAKQGHDAVAAFGVGIKIEGLALVIPIAMCSVLSPFIGTNIGANKNHRIKEGISFAQRLVFIWGVIVWGCVLFWGDHIAGLFIDDPHIKKLITNYLYFVLAGLSMQGIISITITAFNTFRKPLLSTALMTIRLVPILIPAVYFGLITFGVTGAWIGLGTAQIVTGIMGYFWLKHFIDRLPTR